MSSKIYWITRDKDMTDNLMPYYALWSKEPEYNPKTGQYSCVHGGVCVQQTSYKEVLREIAPFPTPRSGQCIKVKVTVERIS